MLSKNVRPYIEIKIIFRYRYLQFHLNIEMNLEDICIWRKLWQLPEGDGGNLQRRRGVGAPLGSWWDQRYWPSIIYIYRFPLSLVWHDEIFNSIIFFHSRHTCFYAIVAFIIFYVTPAVYGRQRQWPHLVLTVFELWHSTNQSQPLLM